MRALWFILKILLKVLMAPVILMLTIFIWLCVGIVYVSGMAMGIVSMVIVVLGVAVLIAYSPANGIILMFMAFLISPFVLPKMAFWLLGKMQGLKFAIRDQVFR